jgi:hypothetical protein
VGEKGSNAPLFSPTRSATPKEIVDSHDIEILLSLLLDTTASAGADEGDEHRSAAAAKPIAQVKAREHAGRLFGATFSCVRTVPTKRDALLTTTTPGMPGPYVGASEARRLAAPGWDARLACGGMRSAFPAADAPPAGGKARASVR